MFPSPPQQEAKIEAEDFTSRLYQELSSSPQPYLVPFLKVRSVTRRFPFLDPFHSPSVDDNEILLDHVKNSDQ